MSRGRGCRAPSPMPRWRRWWCAPGGGPRGRHALVQAGAGRAGGHLTDQRAPYLAGVRAAALADRDVQDLPGPAADRQDPRHGGLYLAPPANAAVFSVDEKPQIQALERTAPVLPMMPGVPERRSFDYTRHGTIDLFAALNIATGKVIGKLSAQHRAVDFRDFLDQIDRQTDPGLAVHVICDNLSTHKAPVVQRWLLAHPRFVLHFTPHLLLVDQPGRAMAGRTAAALPGTRSVLLPGRAHHRARKVDQALERKRPALQMDQDRRPDHRPDLPLLLTHLRTSSLGRSVQRSDGLALEPPAGRSRGLAY